MSIEINASKGIQQNTTEVTKIPVGTTAQRPASPQAGMIRFNTDEGQVEGWNPTLERWQSVSEPFIIQATGGTITDVEQDGQLFRVHTFTSDGTFEVTRGGEVEHLIVAGGGAGSNSTAGGGGAGGLIYVGLERPSVQPFSSVASGVYPVVVGNGGDKGETAQSVGENGEDSSVFGLTAIGGGRGAGNTGSSSGLPALDGGSGGGGSRSTSGTDHQHPTGGSALQPNSPSGGFGNRGGNVFNNEEAAGGGGAGEAGVDGDVGKGGDGLQYAITGTPTFYAGGGAGSSGSNRVGGLGGGGDVDQGGEANTGGGGGGNRGNNSQTAAGGGSGIVIVRYRIG